LRCGQSVSALPLNSDVYLFCDSEGVIDLDTKVPHGAFDPRMAEQELHSPQIPGPSIDQSCFRATDRVGPKLSWVETNPGNPFREKTRILTCCEAAIWAPPAREQELTGPLSESLEIIIYRLTGLLSDLELDRPAGFSLSNGCSIDCITVRRNIFDLQAHHVTASQLAINGEVE
jgi:hypothetical protein